MPKLKVSVSTNKVGSRMEATIPIDAEDLEDLSESEKARYMDDILEQWVWDSVSAHCELVED